MGSLVIYTLRANRSEKLITIKWSITGQLSAFIDFYRTLSNSVRSFFLRSVLTVKLQHGQWNWPKCTYVLSCYHLVICFLYIIIYKHINVIHGCCQVKCLNYFIIQRLEQFVIVSNFPNTIRLE